MGNRFTRMLRHLACDRRDVRRAFPAAALARIEQRIGEGELRHGAEIRVAVEPSLGAWRAWSGAPARDRALEVFGLLRVWDTELNNGVLIHVLLADRAVEIVADRAAARAIDAGEWEAIARVMTDAFRRGAFLDGVLSALDRLEPALGRSFPVEGRNPDELPNRPALL